jgi:hypothetical protein
VWIGVAADESARSSNGITRCVKRVSCVAQGVGGGVAGGHDMDLPKVLLPKLVSAHIFCAAPRNKMTQVIFGAKKVENKYKYVAKTWP